MSEKGEIQKEKSFIVQLLLNLFGFFYLFVFVMCFAYLLIHPEIVTLTFTNIGFAVFLTLANTFFSWARSLDEKKHPEEVKNINHISYWAIIGALTFLITSILLFIINSKPTIGNKIPGTDVFFNLILYMRGILLFIVTAIAFVILLEAYRSIFKLFSREYFNFKSVDST